MTYLAASAADPCANSQTCGREQESQNREWKRAFGPLTREDDRGAGDERDCVKDINVSFGTLHVDVEPLRGVGVEHGGEAIVGMLAVITTVILQPVTKVVVISSIIV